MGVHFGPHQLATCAATIFKNQYQFTFPGILH